MGFLFFKIMDQAVLIEFNQSNFNVYLMKGKIKNVTFYDS